MISRKTYCRALKLLQTQEIFAAESRQILLTLLRDSIDDVCDYTSWWLSETDDFCVWTEDESQRWDLHKPEALYDFITGEYGRAEHICGKNFVTVSILLDADVKEQYELVHAGGCIVSHAHPFREEDYIPEIRLFPDCVDAVEGINATHESPASMSHKNILYNEKAIAYAKEHGLPITAGSDQHTTRMIGGGMLFDRKLSDEKDFCRAVLAGEAKAYWNGSEFYG